MKGRIVALGGVAVMVALAVTLIAWQIVPAQPDGGVQAVRRPTATPPGPLAVEEQNLDASGFIRVHEQGVADVNVVSTAQPPAGVVTTLIDNLSVGASEWLVTPFVNVEDCDSRMVLFAERSASTSFDNAIALDHSPDGIQSFNSFNTVWVSTTPFDGSGPWSGGTSPVAFLDVTGQNKGPFMSFNIRNGLTAQTVSIHLYCR